MRPSPRAYVVDPNVYWVRTFVSGYTHFINIGVTRVVEFRERPIVINKMQSSALSNESSGFVVVFPYPDVSLVRGEMEYPNKSPEDRIYYVIAGVGNEHSTIRRQDKGALFTINPAREL